MQHVTTLKDLIHAHVMLDTVVMEFLAMHCTKVVINPRNTCMQQTLAYILQTLN
jgi:hypothetical protein